LGKSLYRIYPDVECLSLSPTLNKFDKLLHYKTSQEFAETFLLGSMPARERGHLNWLNTNWKRA